MRFAFYGRVSTEDQQDPESSRNWQLARARQLIEPAGGEIVAEFFDVGQSRSLPWSRRPESSRLLQALGDPDRGFDAVVIGDRNELSTATSSASPSPSSSTTGSDSGSQRSVERSIQAPTPTRSS